MSDTSTCTRCGRLIEWVVTEKGKRQPLDPEPTDGPRGNVVIDEGEAVYIFDNERDTFRAGGFEVREAHQATCGH